jgi:hypothetical protein
MILYSLFFYRDSAPFARAKQIHFIFMCLRASFCRYNSWLIQIIILYFVLSSPFYHYHDSFFLSLSLHVLVSSILILIMIIIFCLLLSSVSYPAITIDMPGVFIFVQSHTTFLLSSCDYNWPPFPLIILLQNCVCTV